MSTQTLEREIALSQLLLAKLNVLNAFNLGMISYKEWLIEKVQYESAIERLRGEETKNFG